MMGRILSPAPRRVLSTALLATRYFSSHDTGAGNVQPACFDKKCVVEVWCGGCVVWCGDCEGRIVLRR